MNHLAHALLAARAGGSIVGQLMGDFVKGRLEGRYDDAIREGIALHRRIDAYTDGHAVVRESLARFRPPYRRFAGILTDLFYDHALARRWDEFSDRPLRAFADDVYAELAAARHRLPERMQRFTDYLRAADLLVSYRELEGIDRALAGIARRMRRANPLADAVTELEREEEGLTADFARFFPDLLERFAVPEASPGRGRTGSAPGRRES